MYQRPITEETAADAETSSPMRGLLIAAPLALGFWIAVVGLAAYLV